MGRFISADAFVSTGQGFSGNNMFAYCLNNPANNMDSGGYRTRNYREFGSHAMAYGGGSDTRYIVPDKEREAAEQQRQAHSINNTDEKVVCQSSDYAFYKGTLVIKVPAMEDSAFSFGVIFMGSGVRDEETVKHEYGHTIQLREVGIVAYTEFVVIPSVTCFHLSNAGYLPWINYYSYPWENLADRYGGAQHFYQDGASEWADAYWFLVKNLSR